jgi:hypothetical protein
MPYVNGSFTEPGNGDRAGWAQEALEAFARQTRHDPAEQALMTGTEQEDREHAEEVLSDLLADLQHFARRHGLDWDTCLCRGEMHFEEEVEEEEMAVESDE